MFKVEVNKRSLLSIFFSSSVILLLILVLTLPAYAHRIVSYAYTEGDEIVVEGAYGNGNPVKDCKVIVYDSQENVVYEGRTNSQGIAKFKVSNRSDLRIILDSETGHKSEYIIKEENLPEIKSENKVSSNKEDSSNQQITQVNNSVEESEVETTGISEDRLRKIIQEEVSEELSGELSTDIAAIKQRLVRLEEKKGPGVVEILGGLGYIMGLMGIGLYFKTKGDEQA